MDAMASSFRSVSALPTKTQGTVLMKDLIFHHAFLEMVTRGCGNAGSSELGKSWVILGVLVRKL